MMTLLPLSCMRARDVLAHRALEDADPVVALAALVPAARPQVEATLRQLYFPTPPPELLEPEELRTAREWFHAAYRQRLTAALETLRWTWSTALDPPRPRQRDAAAYCPRCLDQFRAGRSRCEACSGQSLVAFPDPAAS